MLLTVALVLVVLLLVVVVIAVAGVVIEAEDTAMGFALPSILYIMDEDEELKERQCGGNAIPPVWGFFQACFLHLIDNLDQKSPGNITTLSASTVLLPIPQSHKTTTVRSNRISYTTKDTNGNFWCDISLFFSVLTAFSLRSLK
ncbi:hypothetical protein LZ31DRAFT_89758 [Colletotrichum somersetense]|nr:hypothetical protein LZ31DRAFT_89758 [Colletotrichum somersetense]